MTAKYKKGEKYGPAYYRPVSLTRICCKTMIYIVVCNVNQHLALDILLFFKVVSGVPNN